MTYKNKLESLYKLDLTEQEMRSRKASIINQMNNDYEHLKSEWETDSAYDAWFNEGINNAKLATVLTYRDWVSFFLEIYAAEEQDMEKFYERIEHFRHCDMISRERALKKPGQNQC